MKISLAPGMLISAETRFAKRSRRDAEALLETRVELARVAKTAGVAHAGDARASLE